MALSLSCGRITGYPEVTTLATDLTVVSIKAAQRETEKLRRRLALSSIRACKFAIGAFARHIAA